MGSSNDKRSIAVTGGNVGNKDQRPDSIIQVEGLRPADLPCVTAIVVVPPGGPPPADGALPKRIPDILFGKCSNTHWSTPENAGRPISRRKFLKILGTSSAVGLSSCAKDAKEVIFPNVKGDAEQIPGVAAWFSSTCTECPAGCSTRLRVREGRVVKIEGNPASPLSKGGLCALGQAALQRLYDPDRIREPLKRATNPAGETIFTPVSWDEALNAVSESLKNSGGKRAFISGEVSGALDELLDDFCAAFKVERAAFDPLQPVSLARASELVYGEYGIPKYNLGQADFLLNFGADFLETWVSPVEYASEWADARDREKPLKAFTVEPRLSLTGANSDQWIGIKPGTELSLALYLLKQLLGTKPNQLPGDILSELRRITVNSEVEKTSEETGIPREKISTIVEELKKAKNPLVIGGGAPSATPRALSLMAVINFINLVLLGVGSTVDIRHLRRPKSSLSRFADLIKLFADKKVSSVFIYDTNPAYYLPDAFGFAKALEQVPLVVSLSTHLDQSARQAHYVLPINTYIESWGDSRPYEGIYSLIQPAMTPVFNTKQAGDILIELGQRAGRNFAHKSSPGTPAASFDAYLKASWAALHKERGVAEAFQSFWLKSLEQGGFFPGNQENAAKVRTNRSVFTLKFENGEAKPQGQTLLAFPSVRTFDGRAVNRAWLYEIPDPMVQVTWDGWAEMHPETAKAQGLAKEDLVLIKGEGVELSLPVITNAYVQPGVIAVPMGYGQPEVGRYSAQAAAGNVFKLLPAASPVPGSGLTLCGAPISIERGRGRAKIAILQESDSQRGRELAHTSYVGEKEHAQEHQKPKQMYEQREHPLYQWGMTIDLNRCTGCSACVVACYAENNVPVTGKTAHLKGREMAWLRIERYHDGTGERPLVNFLPMLCQQCNNAPCEPVCPVYATYHNEQGLNAMIYNRCVGTRYCSNNCPYKVRRFNWHQFDWPEPLDWQLNPDVTKRSMGIMEKCTFCIQRINDANDRAKDLGRLIQDGEVQPACVQSCSSKALVFGNRKDPDAAVSRMAKDERAYRILDHHLNTQPAISYLGRLKYKD